MSSSPLFSKDDKADVLEFYRLHDVSKVPDVDRIVAACESSGASPCRLFDELFLRHGVARLADRGGAAARLQSAVPAATGAGVERALRLAEMRGRAEADARRSLRRAAGARAAAEGDVAAEECREWIAQVIGSPHNQQVLDEENFVDALRSGVVLLILLQKLREPPVPDEELKIPKRSSGFYARDNVISFLRAAARTFNLSEAQLFTDSDLCDGKNDRIVISCLLSIARNVYKRGATHLAPPIIVFEEEIDSKLKGVSQEFIDRVVDTYIEDENAGEDREKETKCNVEMEVTSGNPVAQKEDAEGKQGFDSNGATILPQTEIQESPDSSSEVESTDKGKTKPQEKVFSNYSARKGSSTHCMTRPTSSTCATSEKEGGEAPPKVQRPLSFHEPPKYCPDKSDTIDVLLSVIVNTHFIIHPLSNVRFRRLAPKSGEYVAHDRASGHKQLLFVRILQRKLMVRHAKDGNLQWLDFKEWLTEYECEINS